MTASSAQPAAPTPAGAAARENPAHGTALLRLDHVSRHYGTLEAVDDVSFDMAPGELRAVIGPNGAGKTTFFNLIGFVPPTRGTVWFDGADITRQTAVRRVGRGIVRTFQITEMLPDLNVLDNIRMGVETAAGLNARPWIPRARREAIDARVDELIRIVDLAGKQCA